MNESMTEAPVREVVVARLRPHVRVLFWPTVLLLAVCAAYGYFGGSSSDSRIRWLLQDMQLDNGYSISNAGIIGEGFKPEIGVSVDAYATLQDKDGNLYYVASTITPVGELWTSPATGNGSPHPARALCHQCLARSP